MPFYHLKKDFSFFNAKTLCLLFLLCPFLLFSQVSNVETYKKVVYKEMLKKGANTFECSEASPKEINTTNVRAKSSAISCAEAFQAGYGTNCWDDTATDPDPACSIPPVISSDCNGGKYRIPIAITIFECFDWSGTNYLETEAGGFEPILNMDLNTKLIEVNELFANSNIEFYEVNRQRVQDCDLYDFYRDTEPSTGFNDSNDDLIESASFDIPNAINLYFVGGLFGDHDCCGMMAFAPYPPGRDYAVLRYGTAVVGSNIAHELGHYFGLPHTYAQSIDFPIIDGDGVPTGSLDNCDCLTQGDRICDTWPDPSFSHNCNHLGPEEACYINMTNGSFCTFDEAAYAEHITESHPGVSPNLLISPNSGTTFSSTSSTVLNQNIMSNNFIFGCTTTFSPCQYKKIHDVARSDCRNYLCNATVADYFLSTSTANYEICVGDDIPTFLAGNSVTRFDGSQYELECFDWYSGEFDERSEALLFNSSSFTPTTDDINTAVAGTYEFWVAEVNALNEPPCKVKVSVRVMDTPGSAITAANDTTIAACEEANVTIDASGASINNDVDLIGWYFSDTNPIESLTTSVAIQTAIQSATNNNIWNRATGNIVQSDANDPLSSLSNVSVDCDALGNGTYFLTPFIAKGAVGQNCSTSSNSSSFDWNIAGGFTGGATVSLGPINDCAIAGLSVDDFSVTLNILDCESVGGAIGAKIFFNRGTELSISTPFDFIFDCTQDIVSISGSDLRNIKPDYDPMVDQIQINFINDNFFRTNFQGTISLSLNARIDVNYTGNNAQVIWDANNSPNIDTSNIDCFWGDPVTVLCDCESSLCPEIGDLTGSSTICLGDTSAFLNVAGIQNIGNFNMEFVYFLDRQTDSSLYVNTPVGLLGNGLMVENVPYPMEAGTYYVYARLNPMPVDSTCRPFQELIVDIIDLPAAPIANDIFYCEGDSVESLVVAGNNVLWYNAPIGGIGTSTPIPNLAVVDTQSYWVSQTINDCESPRTRLDVIRVNEPSPPTIPDVNLCMGDESVEIVEGIPNLKWYTTETSTVGTPETPIINTAAVGTTIYWVSRTDNNCESERVPVDVTINAIPAAPIVADINYFVNDTPAVLTAIGNQLRWYSSVSDTGMSLAPIPTTDVIGLQIYEVSQTINNCESDRVSIAVTIEERPIVEVATEVTSPTNGTNGSITFLDLLPNTGYVVSYTRDSLVVTDTIVAGPIGTITLTGLSSGNYNNITLISDGIMATVMDIVLLDAACEIAAVLNGTDTICSGEDAFLNVTISNGTGPYELTLFDGIDNHEFSNYNSGMNLPFTLDSTRTYTLIQLVDSDSCAIMNTVNPITVRVNRTAAPITNDVMYCQGTDPLPLLAEGRNVRWYEEEIGGEGSDIIIPVTDTIGTQTYWVSQTVNGCESERSSIAVTVEAQPLPPTTVDTSACEGISILLTAEGEQLLWYTSATGGTALSSISSNPDTTGVQSYWVSQTVNGCESERARLDITINAIPAAPIVADINYFVNDTPAALTAIGNQLRWYSSGSDTAMSLAPIPTTDMIGIQIYEVSQTINNCESNRVSIAVTIEERPIVEVATEVTSPTNGTNGSITFLDLIPNTSYVVSYTNDSLVVTDTIVAGPIGTITLTGLSSGNYNNITLTSDGVIATVMDIVLLDAASCNITAILNGTDTICTGEDAFLNVIISNGTGPYELVLSDGTNNHEFSNYSSGTNLPFTLDSTTSYTLIQLIDSDSCAIMDTLNPITVMVNRVVAPITDDVMYCQGMDPLPLMAEGMNVRWYEEETGGEGFDFLIPVTDTIGTQTYWVSQTINGCESERSPIAVTVAAQPIAPTTVDTSVCEGTSILLTAEGEQLLWYTSATGGSSVDSINSDPNIVGNQTYWVSQTINGCESDRARLVVSNLPSPPVPGVLDISYFLNEIATPLMAFGNQLRWYSTATSNDGTSTAPMPNTSILGTQTHWVSQVIGNCESDRVPIDVTVEARISIGLGIIVLPTAAAANGSIQLINLLANTTYTLVYDVNGNTVTNTITTDATGSFVIANLLAGDYTNIRVILNGESSSSLTMELTPVPCNLSVSFSENDMICQGDTSSISLVIENGSNPYRLILREGANLIEFPTYISGTSIPIITTTTKVYSIASLEDSNGCVLAEDDNTGEVTITVQDPAAPTTNDIMYCQGSLVSNPLSAVGTNLLWYDFENGGVGSAIPPTPNTDIVGTQTYWVSQVVGNCESARAMINVIISDDQPSPPIVESVTYCEGETTVPFIVEGANLRWYILPVGGTGITTAPQPTTELSGRYHYWVTQTLNGCESERARISITINETPTPEIGMTMPPSPCLTNGAIQLRNLEPNQDYQFSYTLDNRPVAPSSITTTSIGTYVFSELAAGLYTDIKVQLGACSSVGLQRELVDNTPVIAVDFTGTSTICNGEQGALVVNIEGGVSPYRLLITDIFNTYSLSNYESGDSMIVRPTKTTNYYLVSVQDSNGCISRTETGVVRMNVEDCTSMGSLQNGTPEIATDFLSFGAVDQRLKNSDNFELFQNQPNPFSSQTTIGFHLPDKSEVELILRDNTGRIIKRLKEFGTAGPNNIVIEDLSETKGIIYYQLVTDFGVLSKKMLLVK